MTLNVKKSNLANCLFLLAILFRFINETTANLSFIFLIILCFFGAREIIIALFLTWLFASLNSALVPAASFANVSRFVIIFSGFISSSFFLKWENIILNKNLYLACIILFIFIFLHSIFISYIPEVSILRSLSWSLLFILLINCWSSLDEFTYLKLTRELFILFTILMLSSLTLIGNKIGYLKNNDGFQGVLNHPQLFGVIMGLFGIIILTRFPQQHFSSYIYRILMILTIYLLILSESRTAMLALIGSYIISITLNLFYESKSKKNYNSFFILILIFISIYLLYQLNSFFNFDLLEYILSKSNRSAGSSILESFLESRGDIILRSLQNVNENFWAGIGFGIASDYENMSVLRDNFFDIPYSAPVEKGLLYMAILEEIGFFGFLLFLFFLMICFLSLSPSESQSFPILVIILLFNIGESTFFSPGGLGGLLTLFLTLSISKKNIKHKSI